MLASLTKSIKLIRQKIRIKLYFFREVYHFYKLITKYNASVNTNNDIEKMQYTLLRENHTIEKGLSIKNPRKGFGQKKVENLLIRLDKYVSLFYKKDKYFINYPMSTIRYYIEYTLNSGTKIPNIESQYKRLLNRLDNQEFTFIKSGVTNETKEHILTECNKNFESLLNSRHSLRFFTKEIVSRDLLDKALDLSKRTPSACNRQGWKTHIFQGEKSHILLKWQDGCRGFEENIHTSILVTANLKAFLSYEIYQAYVDGGLYAMNLINALHSLGLGTIPLSVAFDYKKLNKLSKFEIPENEIPIVIIGVGNIPEKNIVAVSDRKAIKETNIYH